MGRAFSTLDTINILFLVYSNCCIKKSILKVRKRIVMAFIYFFVRNLNKPSIKYKLCPKVKKNQSIRIEIFFCHNANYFLEQLYCFNIRRELKFSYLSIFCIHHFGPRQDIPHLNEYCTPRLLSLFNIPIKMSLLILLI